MLSIVAQSAITQSTLGDELDMFPPYDTTMPAAPLAICNAKRMDKPLAKHEIIIATTVSPAPLHIEYILLCCWIMPSSAIFSYNSNRPSLNGYR